MRRPFAIVVLVAVGGALMPVISEAQKVQTQVDIAAMQPGTAPPGFNFWRTGYGASRNGR